MKKIMIGLLMILSLTFLLPKWNVFGADLIVYTDDDYQRLHAVIQHVDNVLKYGHEYNEEIYFLMPSIH